MFFYVQSSVHINKWSFRTQAPLCASCRRSPRWRWPGTTSRCWASRWRRWSSCWTTSTAPAPPRCNAHLPPRPRRAPLRRPTSPPLPLPLLLLPPPPRRIIRSTLAPSRPCRSSPPSPPPRPRPRRCPRPTPCTGGLPGRPLSTPACRAPARLCPTIPLRTCTTRSLLWRLLWLRTRPSRWATSEASTCNTCDESCFVSFSQTDRQRLRCDCVLQCRQFELGSDYRRSVLLAMV